MREVVLDTETTGLSPKDGHRIVEIGCIELINHIPTGQKYQTYINPERDMPFAASKITGLTGEFLINHPVFSVIVDNFLEFIEGATLVIHNAPFDVAFLNSELERLNKKTITLSEVVDTLPLARQRFPGSPASLDALCKRFQVDLSKREYHGALLDAELLSAVYLELRGGRQKTLLTAIKGQEAPENMPLIQEVNFPKRSYPVSLEELEAHRSFVNSIKGPLWQLG